MSGARDHMSAPKVYRVLLVLLLIAGPHMLRLPLWASALVIAMGIWRALAAQRTWPMPGALLRNLLAGLALTGVWMQYQTLNGHHAGVALLVVMLGMKLTEMSTRRDYLVVIYLSYFLLITHFLFSQEMVMLLLMFAGALAITSVLIEVNHPQGSMPIRRNLRLAASLMLQAAPLMLIFFLLFPRIPGPLWGIPSDASAGLTGLSDSMEPGMISELGRSDEVAFRVRFDDQAPARRELYWRGPVFEYFNGRSWLPGPWDEQHLTSDIEFSGPPVTYEMQLEAHGKRWLLALDLPRGPLPESAMLSRNLVLRHKWDVIDKKLYRLASGTRYRVDNNASPRYLGHQRALPTASNPQTRELALSWKARNDDPAAIIDTALKHFAEQPFHYTLRPPLLNNQHSIDQFLFESRRGFCEHYASAFTFMMRAAGIPARVVTGYQGAERNGDYYIVRQSDAHAWSEVWLQDQGWVRIDPTAAVSPERVELGLGGALPAGEPVPGLARLGGGTLVQLQLRWDQVNAAWNRWVLAYGPELQQSLMAALGMPGLRALLITLTVLTICSLLAVNLLVNRAQRNTLQRDPVYQVWQRFVAKLKRAGLAPLPTEGPMDLSRRVAAQRPALASEVERICQLYVRLRYASRSIDPSLLKSLRQRVRKFRPPRLRFSESPTSHPAGR